VRLDIRTFKTHTTPAKVSYLPAPAIHEERSLFPAMVCFGGRELDALEYLGRQQVSLHCGHICS
jgi:hypothetical protein